MSVKTVYIPSLKILSCDIPYDITYMWNPEYDTNKLIYDTEADSQT